MLAMFVDQLGANSPHQLLIAAAAWASVCIFVSVYLTSAFVSVSDLRHKVLLLMFIW